jgi:hypothetical protein
MLKEKREKEKGLLTVGWEGLFRSLLLDLALFDRLFQDGFVFADGIFYQQVGNVDQYR